MYIDLIVIMKKKSTKKQNVKRKIIAALKHKSVFAESMQPNMASLSRSITEVRMRVQRQRDNYTVK